MRPEVLAQAIESSGWTVTTSVAAVAAGVSLLTLLVTTYYAGRREHQKWAREQLSQAVYEMIDSSYFFSDAMGDIQRAHWEGVAAADKSEYEATLDTAELRSRQALSKLRLLAPGRTVRPATDLRRQLQDARKHLGADLTDAAFTERADGVSRARLAVIESAKKDMSLPG